MRIAVLSLMLATSVAVSGCSSSNIPFVGGKDKNALPDVTEQATDKTLYKNGIANLNTGRYKTAIKDFEEIERVYPFSKLASKAQVMIAYSLYKDQEYDSAITVVDRFAKLHPAHDDIDYMYYLKAISYYERISDVKRDQKITLQALSALQEIGRRFPDSQYARDAKLKIDLVYDHLAGKEMQIGRYYLRDKKFVAGINRFKRVVEKYDTTSHAPEALYRLTEAYLSAEALEEARKYASVLGHNYPNSRWYKYAYKLTAEGADAATDEKRSWLPVIIPSVDLPTITLPSWGKDAGDSEVTELPKDQSTERWFDKIKRGVLGR